MRHPLTLLILFYACGLATRIDAENTAEKSATVTLIEQFESNSHRLKEERIPIFEEELLTAESPRQRMVAAMALGLHYLEKMHLRIALQYLAIARELNNKQAGPLGAIIDLGFAKIRYAYGDYQTAVVISAQVLEQKLSRTRFDDASLIHLKSLFKLGRYREAANAYTAYKRERTLRTAHAEVLQYAAMAMREVGKIEDEQELLEALAEQYPLNPESIWAFNLLQDDNCPDSRGKRRYYFSERLLRHLSINRKLDPGLPTFLVQKAAEPIRERSGRVRVLPQLDQIDLILRMNLDREALAFEQQLLHLAKNGSFNERPEALGLLARLYSTQDDYLKTIRYYNELLSLYPKHKDRFRTRAALAFTLQKVGAFAAAAENYGYLTKYSRQSIYRWEHFWNTYLAKDYEGALALLDKPGYVRLKDPKEPLALTYWRARILEHLGREEESERYYKDILLSDATSFYANLVLAKKPKYWQQMLPDDLRATTAVVEQPEPIRLAAMNFTPEAVSKAASSGLQLLQELVNAGLDREARIQLRTIDKRHVSGSEITEVESLAYYLADYRSFRRLSSNEYNLDDSPRGLAELVMHNFKYRDNWRAHYPLAFDGILDTVANYFGVSKFLLLALMRAESRYDIFAQSWVGARGLMQIMPKTAVRISDLVENPQFDVDDLYDPSINLTYGAFYIDLLLKQFQDNPFVAIASYNAGPIAVSSWLRRCKGCDVDEFVESIPYRETRRYVKSVIKYFGQYSRIYQFDQPFWSIPELPKDLPNEDELF